LVDLGQGFCNHVEGAERIGEFSPLTTIRLANHGHQNTSHESCQISKHLDALIKEYKALEPKFKIMANHAKDLCEKDMSKQIPAILSQRCKALSH
jgi:hypothetical protein